MTEPLVLCACDQPAAWYDHSAQANLCDDCNGGLNEPLAQSLTLPLSAKRIARLRQRRDRREGDDWTGARWLATLDAERQRSQDARLLAIGLLNVLSSAADRLTSEEARTVAALVSRTTGTPNPFLPPEPAP